MSRIQELAAKYADQVIAYRRHMHMYPEVSLEEKETAKFIAEKLREMGLEPQENIGGYGVVAVIEGGKGPGKCVGLRADFDALPIQEETGLPFASKNPGVSHACGHDMHAAMLLGAAHVLLEMKDEFAGSVKLVFQPAEEWVLCGGAIDMIRDGVMENPHVDAMIGQHVEPTAELGTVVLRRGPEMSSTDRLFLTVKGQSCHGSRPHLGIDGVVIASQIITALQTVVARNSPPVEPVVITFGRIEGGERYDILAKEVKLEGTYRTFCNEWRDKVPQYVDKIAKGVCEALGGDYEFKVGKGYPPTINDDGMFDLVHETATKLLGKDKVVVAREPNMGGEDFSFFAQMVPGMYYNVGGRPSHVPVEEARPLHNNGFNPDESCMQVGVSVLVGGALDFLAK